MSIIRLIVETAHLLDKDIICEGVEYLEDVELLNQLNCHFGQGYYVSKPVHHLDFSDKYLLKQQ